MRASGAVTRSTLRQQIADALRDEVLAGRLQPGREFTVKQIAEQYGVSATPVREALFDLSAQGLLESDQHRGFRVHEFTVADYRAMVEARTLVMDGVIREVFTGPPLAAGAGRLPGCARLRTPPGRGGLPCGARRRPGHPHRLRPALLARAGRARLQQLHHRLPAPVARPGLGVRRPVPAR